jgi:hypothetical protein
MGLEVEMQSCVGLAYYKETFIQTSTDNWAWEAEMQSRVELAHLQGNIHPDFYGQ